jgi:hypothetical protein
VVAVSASFLLVQRTLQCVPVFCAAPSSPDAAAQAVERARSHGRAPLGCRRAAGGEAAGPTAAGRAARSVGCARQASPRAHHRARLPGGKVDAPAAPSAAGGQRLYALPRQRRRVGARGAAIARRGQWRQNLRVVCGVCVCANLSTRAHAQPEGEEPPLEEYDTVIAVLYVEQELPRLNMTAELYEEAPRGADDEGWFSEAPSPPRAANERDGPAKLVYPLSKFQQVTCARTRAFCACRSARC